MKYGSFEIEAFEREPGRWRASVRRTDGSRVRVGETRFDNFYTSADADAVQEAVQLAIEAIDAKAVQ